MATASKPFTVHSFFSRRGPLSRAHPNYEFRDGQLKMAEAVEAALSERRHMLVEAGTGTGKTLAYLVPAILSKKRVVISTGTKNLQEQLFFKDIPFLEQFFPGGIKACYMKGRNNYACRQKIYDAEREPVLEGLSEVSDFQIIRGWEESTESGDRSELTGFTDSTSVWHKLDARRDRCTGQKCKQYDRCFITLMRQRAFESDIIVVNHHLFFADLAGRESDFGGILPDYAAVIFDEAHDIEDIAGQYFGQTFSNLQVEDLRRDVLDLARRKEFASPELDHLLINLLDHSTRLFRLFGEENGRQSFTGETRLREEHSEPYTHFMSTLKLLSTRLQLIQNASDELAPLVRRCEEMIDRLRFWMESPDRTFVYWVERRGFGVFLQTTPIDVSRILRTKLFETLPASVLTSATLAVGGTFDFARSRFGLDSPRELIVPSHFDYAKQSILYVPQHLPDVRTPGFINAAAVEVSRILRLSRGRAFVLFTSYQQMRAIRELVAGDLGYPTLMQGEAPPRALLDEFRVTPHCVLFATSAFWQGVDVQGDQLSCVIIDRLPFAVPTDPIIQARSRALEAAGGNAFFDYQVPQAALALKQGFGRLIRSRNDRGILALLDNRITRQRYGQIFFDSLPDYAFTTSIDDVADFFGA